MRDWISLNMTPFVGPRASAKLLQRFGSAENVFHATRSELESLRLRAEAIDSIQNKEFHDKAEAELEQVKALGGDVLILDDGSYPFLLREISDPPITLYVRGNWQACFDAPCVGVVGSRKCSTYGENASQMLSRDLAKEGICIVSGLARGIDSAAHRGTIEAGGKTIAVLGTGLDNIYPKENARLVEEILESGGAIVTQFPLGTPPLRENFPYRNRVISGLSLGVLVVEASEKSGSLITARLATEQNREVFAVPGNITSKNSFGTNYLIKSGAKLVQQWQDVVNELPTDISSEILPPKIKKTVEEKPQAELLPADLTEQELKIWKLLSTDEPTHVDDLVEKTGYPVGDLLMSLLGLEMRELIREVTAKRYARKI
ncbi:MAG: DNA-processing protein DprA [Pyrinomonadaceae bacterium]|nr:DNA-processing protein DprA [Pyrinomonadaceae bacterium]